MTSFNFRWIIACFAVIAALSFQSCSDEKSYDVVGDTANIIYINTQQWSPINSPKNLFSFAVVHTPVGEFGVVKAKFPVNSTKPMSNSVTVSAELDNSLVDTYNKTYGTKCVALPSGILSMSKSNATIAAGKSVSVDSITVSIDSAKLVLLTGSTYLAPISLVSVSESGAEISKVYNTAYVLITTSTSLIKKNVGSSGMLGSLVPNYSAWTVTSDVTPSKYTFSTIFDGSTSTRWQFPSTPVTLLIDMKDTKKVSGFRTFAQYAQYGYIFSQIKVSLSSDNVTFNELGTCTSNDMANESGYQYVGFYGAMDARYIKLTLAWNSSYYPYLCELGVYIK